MIYIIDDFYPNPDEVREKALSFEYKRGESKIDGKVLHPGHRHLTDNSNDRWVLKNRQYLKNRWASIVGTRPWYWEKMTSNCAFNLGFDDRENRFSWVHSDNAIQRKHLKNIQMWACVIYLTPNPPPKTGTLLLENPKGSIYDNEYKEGEKDKYYPPIRNCYWDNPVAFNPEWKVHAVVGNRYNRCVMYDAHMLHAPEDAGFGTTKETGRLTQIGFWFSERV